MTVHRFPTFDANDFGPVDYVLDTTDSESVEDMFGRFGFANRATREPSLKKSRPSGRVSTIAGWLVCIAVAVFLGISLAVQL